MSVLTAVNINSEVPLAMDELTLNQPYKQKEDCFGKEIKKLMDTSKTKLSSLDSQRILSVLDETILKTEIATLLPYVIENLDRYSVMLGNNLCCVLQKYDQTLNLFTKSLSTLRKYEHNMSLGKNSKVTEKFDDKYNEVEIKEMTENYHDHFEQLTEIIKSVLRLFRSNPAALNTIINEKNERSSECSTFINYMNLLKDDMFSKLVTTPGEEKDKQRTTIQVMAREKKALNLIRRLDEELSVSTKEKEDMIKEKNDVMRSLKSVIQGLEQGSGLVNRKILADSQKVESVELKNSDSKKITLQQDLIQMKQLYQGNMNQHRESELALRKRKYKIETEVENWVQSYDTDMAERQDEIDELSIIYKEEKNQLLELEEKFRILSKQYEQIIEERRIALEKREQAEREFRNMVKAATVLQSFWKAYKCRKMLKAKQKKNKKGKASSKKKR